MKSYQPYLTFFALLIITIIACNNSENKTGATPLLTRQLVFDKLTGTWQSEGGKSFETWTKKNDRTYQSIAYTLHDIDTSWDEHANIYLENGKWVFENTVKRQNDGKAVKFVSSFLNETSVQFSNPAHDFPTDVNYTVKDANTVFAFIIGPNKKGGRDTIAFNYTRVK